MTTKDSDTTQAHVTEAEGLPVLGAVWEMMRDPLGYMDRSSGEGDIVRFRFGGEAYGITAWMLYQPDDIKHVFIDNHRNYRKADTYDALRFLLGDGLLTSEGDFWRHQRRLANPAFHRKRLQGLATLMLETTEHEIEANTPKLGQEVDVAAWMRRATLAILTRSMFSAGLKDEDIGVIDHSLDALLQFAVLRASLPFKVLDYLPTPLLLRSRKGLQAMDAIVDRLISAREKNPDAHNDLLSMLMNARDEKTGKGMTRRQLRDEVMTFLVAGHETTANALAWTFFLLAQNPEAEARLQNELDTVLGDRPLCFEDLSKLGYTNRVIQESMRLYPPAWTVERNAIEQDSIRGVTIPAGDLVMLTPWITHRSPKLWDAPERFEPDRFLPERTKNHPKLRYFPFGVGQRKCIGERFAMMECQLVLAVLCRRYRLRLVEPKQQVELEPLVTLRPKGRLPLLFESR